jgi:hypothetical protein
VKRKATRVGKTGRGDAGLLSSYQRRGKTAEVFNSLSFDCGAIINYELVRDDATAGQNDVVPQIESTQF